MDTLQRVKTWLARSLEISEEMMTSQSSLGDLYRARPRTRSLEDDGGAWSPFMGGVSPDSLDAIELIMLFEDEFDLEFPEADAEAFTQLWLDETTTVQQIVELIDKNS